jgi:hypothetical protein
VTAPVYARGIQNKPSKSPNRCKPTADWIDEKTALRHKPKVCHRIRLHPLARHNSTLMKLVIKLLK